MSGWGIKDDKTATGTISIASNGTLTGSSTLLTTQAAPGDYITVDLTGGATGAVREWVIKSIASNTSAVVMPANPEQSYTTAYADFTNFGAQTFKLSEKPLFVTFGDSTALLSTDVYGVDTNEIQAAAATKGIAHAGWVAKTVRGSRTTYETLVALSKNGASPANMGDREDTVFPDAVITIVTQPTATKSAAAGAAIANLGTVVASVVPSTATITYQWQHSVDGGSSYSNINVSGGVFTGADTATLGVNAGLTDSSSTWNAAKFRCVMSVTGGANVTSGVVTLTIT